MVTPQRTADRRFVAPTPTMAPVIVWVVLTGMPRVCVEKERDRPGCFGADPFQQARPW